MNLFTEANVLKALYSLYFFSNKSNQLAASTALAIFSVINLVSFLHSYDSSVTGCLGHYHCLKTTMNLSTKHQVFQKLNNLFY